MAKAIGDNNKLLSLNISNNSFTNETVEVLIDSLTRNLILVELNLEGNHISCRYDTRIRHDPSILLIGKEAVCYRFLVAAATNQSLKRLRVTILSSMHSMSVLLLGFSDRKEPLGRTLYQTDVRSSSEIGEHFPRGTRLDRFLVQQQGSAGHPSILRRSS